MLCYKVKDCYFVKFKKKIMESQDDEKHQPWINEIILMYFYIWDFMH